MTDQVKAREFWIKDQKVLVDEEDYPVVSRLKWHLKKDKKTSYAYTNIKIGGVQTTLSLHRFITGMSSGQIDHVNRNGLDNRKSNLRYATNSQNSCNRIRKNSHGYRGVYRRASGVYAFQIQKDGRKYHEGGFLTPEEAALAYDFKSEELHGEFGIRNFKK